MQPDYFLKTAFREFYRHNPVNSVPGIGQREFGYGIFGHKILQRHLAFRDAKEFNEFLVKEAPLYVSASAAYYEFPERKPMEAKNRLKSDIVYEFDSDDLRIDCQNEHDSWECRCGKKGKGIVERCSECGERVEVKEWPCENCLEEVKKQMFSLIELVKGDFGLEEGLSVNFSGSKGFHLHLRSKEIQSLTNNARIELLDYLTLNELNTEFIGFGKQKRLLSPKQGEVKGWGKRILEEMQKIVGRGDAKELVKKSAVGHKTAEEIVKKRDEILEALEKGERLQSFPKAEKFWSSLLESIVEQLILKIDRQTSVDASKILRVPDSLHGGTGFKASSIPLDKLGEFKAFSEAIAFSNNPVKVFIREAPKVRFGGQSFGPFLQEEAELPEYAAVYFAAKGAANGVVL